MFHICLRWKNRAISLGSHAATVNAEIQDRGPACAASPLLRGLFMEMKSSQKQQSDAFGHKVDLGSPLLFNVI